MTAKKRQPVLAEREKTHGSYAATATISQMIKNVLHFHPNWNRLSSAQKESMEMIALKMARILSGKANEPDHWVDISGYAELIVEELKCSK